MALKAVIAKLDEVDEKYRDLYTERDGKFEFTGVEGLKTQADIDRQLAANQKVRGDLTKAQNDLKEANTKLQAWTELGEDADEVREKVEKLANLEAAGGVPELAKNFETTVAARAREIAAAETKRETSKIQRQNDELRRQLAETTGLNDQYKLREDTRTVHDAVRAAAVAAKVIPEAMSDVLLVAGQDLKLVDGKVVTEDGRDPAAVIEDYKSKRPYYWPASQGTGARGSDGKPLPAGKDNPFSRQGWNVTKAGQILKSDPAQAAKLAEQAGVPKDEATGQFKWHVMPAEATK